MSDTDSAEPPRRRRAVRTKSRSAGTRAEGVPRPSAEEDARDDQNASIVEKGDAADRDRGAAANTGAGQDQTDEGDGDPGSEDGTIEETLPMKGTTMRPIRAPSAASPQRRRMGDTSLSSGWLGARPSRSPCSPAANRRA